MGALAKFYVASILFDENEVTAARRMLDSLLATETLPPANHKALIARIRYEISLCDAVVGHWSESLQGANQASATYRELGERGTEADAEAVISEDYDFLGKREAALERGLAALRLACASGDFRRARTILAALSRTELRAGEW